MSQLRLSRRQILEGALKGTAILALPVLQGGCGKKELVCSDTAGMSFEDTNTRKALEYVEPSADPARACDGCQLYKPTSPDACGSCTVVKGPIHPKGTCKSFVKKA